MFFKKTPDDNRISEFLDLFARRLSVVSTIEREASRPDIFLLETRISSFDQRRVEEVRLWLNKYAQESSVIQLNEYVVKFTATFDKNRLDEIITQLQLNDRAALTVA